MRGVLSPSPSSGNTTGDEDPRIPSEAFTSARRTPVDAGLPPIVVDTGSWFVWQDEKEAIEDEVAGLQKRIEELRTRWWAAHDGQRSLGLGEGS